MVYCVQALTFPLPALLTPTPPPPTLYPSSSSSSSSCFPLLQNGDTALSEASMGGHVDIVTILLDANASVNVRGLVSIIQL